MARLHGGLFLVFLPLPLLLPLPLRWHPRFVLPASRVAPVRGGTYFSLPPQRKVGKESG
ncbi:hypothetical protein [Paraburkholderia terrae]